MFKVSNRNTKTKHEKCDKDIRTMPSVVLVSLLLTWTYFAPSCSASNNFEHVNAGWEPPCRGSLRKKRENTGFCWLVFSQDSVYIWENMNQQNPYFHIIYAVDWSKHPATYACMANLTIMKTEAANISPLVPSKWNSCLGLYQIATSKAIRFLKSTWI